jgi:YidC/Oxa1 family membrane protein insertase
MGAIFAWNYFYVEPKLQKAKIENVQNIAQKSVSQQTTSNASLNTEGNSDELSPKAQESKNVLGDNPQISELKNELEVISNSREKVIESGFSSNQRVKISTSKLHGSINLQGGIIDDITFSDYKETMDEKSPEVILLSPKRTSKVYFANLGWVSSDKNLKVPNENTIWKVEDNKILSVGSNVTLVYNNGEGVTFKKIFSIDERYMLNVKLEVLNESGKDIVISNFGLINRSWDLKTKSQFVSHEGFIAVADEKLKESKYKDLKGETPVEYSNTSGWIAIGDKYWLTAIIPQNSHQDKFDISFKHYQKDGLDRFQNDIISKPSLIKAKENNSYSFNVYAGAKKLDYLEDYKEKLNITLFERSIDFGSLYFLTKPIFKSLTFFHDHVGNMGIAIMILTVCIRLILFPLANASYKSMARLKKHMPDINKIKERYKNDKQKQGMEMMKYYKEHKISPAAGCAPVLIQIPVFFALYRVLYVTIEMRHEPFIWFIKDLSASDPTNIFTLFGLIMWEVPKWLPHVGILPILFSFSMFVQQRLNPTIQDETQRIVMNWMPWIFLFVFSGFASGLVIYWIWNNILSIIQQAIITRKINEDSKE